MALKWKSCFEKWAYKIILHLVAHEIERKFIFSYSRFSCTKASATREKSSSFDAGSTLMDLLKAS